MSLTLTGNVNMEINLRKNTTLASEQMNGVNMKPKIFFYALTAHNQQKQKDFESPLQNVEDSSKI